MRFFSVPGVRPEKFLTLVAELLGDDTGACVRVLEKVLRVAVEFSPEADVAYYRHIFLPAFGMEVVFEWLFFSCGNFYKLASRIVVVLRGSERNGAIWSDGNDAACSRVRALTMVACRRCADRGATPLELAVWVDGDLGCFGIGWEKRFSGFFPLLAAS